MDSSAKDKPRSRDDDTTEKMADLATEIQQSVDASIGEMEDLAIGIKETEDVESQTSDDSEFVMWESPLKQSTYMFIWALASLGSFAVFFRYF
ncbi:MAG: hypothetical protein CMA28_00205 [Euryarchaeota archaeon]|jgi:hypothetical protein|nr:hypothetical protein [Euryarchaeota archaeon]|tara:strand:+ start:2602 stop:2880 length:279 start_codon:yes stop_codon:yes gene_type:complete